MKKKNPLLLALAALAALAVLYAGLTALKTKNETAAADDEAARLAVLAFEGASEIVYNYGASDLAFSYTEAGGWVCEQHKSWPIDQNALETLEYDLGGLKAVRVLEQHDELASYGLDAPQYTVRITDSEGGSHTLLMSAAEDVNGNRYAAVAGDERVFTISSTLADALGKDILSYVDFEQLPSLAEDDVTALTLAAGEDIWVYTRYEVSAADTSAIADAAETAEAAGETEATAAETEPQYAWKCLKNGEEVEPVFENVESAVYELTQLSLSSCAAYEPSDELKETYGLAEPAATMTVEYDKNDASASYTLIVGGTVADSADNAYVMLEGSQAVTLCAYEALSDAISLLRSA